MGYFVGGVFIALFVWAAVRSFYFRYRGIATTGTIVALERITDGDGDTCKPVVTFTTREGVHIEAKSMYSTGEAGTYFRVGEKVTLRYAASKPTRLAPFIHLKDFLFAVLFGFFGVLSSAHGQTKANQVYADPDEMRLLVPTAVAQAANYALSSAERVALCRKAQGFIEFRFQVDGNGRIKDITSVRLFQAAQEVPAPLLAKMKERVRQDVVFHVPEIDKPPAMSRWRRPSYAIPLTVFCH